MRRHGQWLNEGGNSPNLIIK